MKIVITDCDHCFFTPEESVIERAGYSLKISQCRRPEEIIEVAQDAEALICQFLPITQSLLASLPKCRVVGRYGVGVDNVDLEAATASGIKVVHVPDFCSEEVADHTMGLILALTRRITSIAASWRRDPEAFKERWGRRLELLEGVRCSSDLTLGIIGFGRIGQGVARRAQGFGFRVVAHDAYVLPTQMEERGVEEISYEELLKTADVVTLHIPLTKKTHSIIGEGQLRLMKPEAYLVNTSRGALVDEAALVRALRESWIAGAALDVTVTEPLSASHPLLSMDNVILTPHVAFFSNAAILQLKERVAQYVVNALSERGEYHLANPAVLHAAKNTASHARKSSAALS
jgi:D-3-phosphoglycerate dehydrogenase